jgi:hypothetical protein
VDTTTQGGEHGSPPWPSPKSGEFSVPRTAKSPDFPLAAKTGEEACIAHGSYYADTRYNYYANGQSLLNNINSSKQDPTFSCHGG